MHDGGVRGTRDGEGVLGPFDRSCFQDGDTVAEMLRCQTRIAHGHANISIPCERGDLRQGDASLHEPTDEGVAQGVQAEVGYSGYDRRPL